jgi:hypothetical protein
MRIYIPHPFKNHDRYFNVNASYKFMFKPWYCKFKDQDMKLMHNVDVYDNYAGWLRFTFSWYSSK